MDLSLWAYQQEGSTTKSTTPCLETVILIGLSKPFLSKVWYSSRGLLRCSWEVAWWIELGATFMSWSWNFWLFSTESTIDGSLIWKRVVNLSLCLVGQFILLACVASFSWANMLFPLSKITNVPPLTFQTSASAGFLPYSLSINWPMPFLIFHMHTATQPIVYIQIRGIVWLLTKKGCF